MVGTVMHRVDERNQSESLSSLEFENTEIITMLNFLRSKFDRNRPSQLLKHLYNDLNGTDGGKLSSRPPSSSLSDAQSDDKGQSISKRYSELEEFLGAAVTGNLINGKPAKPDEIERCIDIAIENDILFVIALRINDVGRELRRIVSNVWNLLLKLEHPKTKQRSLVNYLIGHTGCIGTLFSAYAAKSEGVINIGVMLRDSLKCLEIAKYAFQHGLIPQLFDVITVSNFDVSADAFQTMREALSNHKDLGCTWLVENYDSFFNRFLGLLDASSSDDSYVLVRQALNLLASLILDRHFMQLMLKCVDDEALLKHILMLLTHKSKVIELESFHILKVFVANPNKQAKVEKILTQNMTRIIKLLDRIEDSRPDDKDFIMDKRAVVAKLEALAPVVTSDAEGKIA